MKTILLVSNSISSGSFGGVNNYIKLLYKNFNKPSMRLEHFSLGKSPNWYKGEGRMNKYTYFIIQFFIFFKFVFHLKRKDISMVHFFPSLSKSYLLRVFFLQMGACICGVKCVVHFRGWNSSLMSSISRNFLLNLIFRYIIENSFKILVLAKDFKTEIRTSFPNISDGKIIVTTTMVSPEKYRIKRNYSNEPNRLLFCGEIKKSKGIFLLISIMPNLIIDYPQLKLLVMGSGSNKELIQEIKFRKLESHVLFFGYLSENDKITVYKSSDIFVLPTYHNEGFPNVIPEALASGLPIIATPVGGIKDSVGDGINGLILSSPQPSKTELLTKIKSLLDSKKQFKDMSLRNSNCAENRYSVPIVVDNIFEIYKSTIYKT